MLKPGALWVLALTGKFVITSVVPGVTRDWISLSKADETRNRFTRSFKFGARRPLLAVVSVLALLTSYPALSWLVDAPSFSRLMAVELWLSFLFASYNGALIPFLTEIMPPNVRTAGFSLVHSGATAIFGGFTPAISTFLIHVTGNRAIPGLWLSFAAACGLIATALLSSSRVARRTAMHDAAVADRRLGVASPSSK